jgi:hypothetical protein
LIIFNISTQCSTSNLKEEAGSFETSIILTISLWRSQQVPLTCQ